MFGYHFLKFKFLFYNKKATLDILENPLKMFKNKKKLEYFINKMENEFHFDFFINNHLVYFKKFISEYKPTNYDTDKLNKMYLQSYYFFSFSLTNKFMENYKQISKIPIYNKFTMDLFYLNFIINDFLNHSIRNKGIFESPKYKLNIYLIKTKNLILMCEILTLHLIKQLFNIELSKIKFKIFVLKKEEFKPINEVEYIDLYSKIFINIDFNSIIDEIDPVILI
jgi:hypothetical protein